MGAFVVQGVRHILFGADHMLFVLGLLLIVIKRSLDAAEDGDRINRRTQQHASDCDPWLCGGACPAVECRDCTECTEYSFSGP